VVLAARALLLATWTSLYGNNAALLLFSGHNDTVVGVGPVLTRHVRGHGRPRPKACPSTGRGQPQHLGQLGARTCQCVHT